MKWRRKYIIIVLKNTPYHTVYSKEGKMKPITLGRDDYGSRSVPIQHISNDTFADSDIKDSCFLLTAVYEGEVSFKIGDTVIEATSPCLVCFDESVAPQVVYNNRAKCDSVYFHPSFLNVNMTFALVHSKGYAELALLHDMFLLKPFTDSGRFVFHIFDEHICNVKGTLANLKHALICQSDWYWSCRARSYFIELLLFLERLYGLNEENVYAGRKTFSNPQVKNAVIFIENNYRDDISLESIVKSASINHSTLTKLFKSELGMTPMEYLWHHRLMVAKKFLEFTNLPIKEISLRCGFKTTQHFTRRFTKAFGAAPGAFRTDAVQKRKAAF